MSDFNLPKCNLKIIKNESGEYAQVYDILRNKYVSLTPEEFVRQHFIHYLINYKNFPASLMANEVAIKLNGTSKRCDSIVYDRTGKPLMIIEYKAPTVKITQEVFDQIVRYNMVLQVKYLIVCNGANQYICEIDYKNKGYHFLRDIPQYSEL